MIQYLLIVNGRGNVLLARFYKYIALADRVRLQTDVIRTCLTRSSKLSTVLDYEDYSLVYKRFNSITFIAGVTIDENELAVIEFFRHIVEILIKYFGNLSELHFSFSLDKVHMILDEMLVNGYIAETNSTRIMAPLQLMAAAKK